jgi:hypothetical protein
MVADQRDSGQRISLARPRDDRQPKIVVRTITINYLQLVGAPIASHQAKGRARADTGDFGGDFSVEGAKTRTPAQRARRTGRRSS